MVQEILLAGVLGGIGGAVRSLVGLLKAVSKKQGLSVRYWTATVAIAVLGSGPEAADLDAAQGTPGPRLLA